MAQSCVGQQLALRVDDGHRAHVLALQRAATGEFDQGDVLHGLDCEGLWVPLRSWGAGATPAWLANAPGVRGCSTLRARADVFLALCPSHANAVVG